MSPGEPPGMSAGKPRKLEKPARQLLFLEALLQHRSPTDTRTLSPSGYSANKSDKASDNTMERILNELMAVNCRLDGMDSNIPALTAKTKSILSDIAGFQSQVASLEVCMASTEDRLNKIPDSDQELLYLCSKVIDLEDRSHRDNICFFGFPEHQNALTRRSFTRPPSGLSQVSPLTPHWNCNERTA
ncbi:hypothetical protein NDU88_006561 [Pleurodeles waltl]|uniref:Uncharacterized protein n=1 Tax=Pleurodeles waltl TaxID=8319 RepID=A0AAV7UPD2_PLEWA|nr:hypothetical protein NDU88_006561 [Pleurodeles waltl]